jgi:hypothetical protein
MHECIEFLAGEPVFTHQLAYKPFWEELSAAVRFQVPTLDTPAITVIAIGTMLELVNGKKNKVELDNLIAGWLSKYVWPICGRTVELVSMPNVRTATDSFTKPLEGKPVMIVELPAKDQA